MPEDKDKDQGSAKAEPHRVRLPGFIRDEEIGLGDAVKRMTYAMGVRQACGGCERRAAALNSVDGLHPLILTAGEPEKGREDHGSARNK